MSWPNDEARRLLTQALLTFKELYGDEQTINFLEQELMREHVIKERRAAQRLLAPPAGNAVSQAADLDTTVRALEFYADDSNYEAPKSGRDKRPEVLKDNGTRASNALSAIAHDEGDGEAR